MRVLLVEDDSLIANGVLTALKEQGYVVDWLTDGLHAIEAVNNENFDLVVLDVGLPGKDGFEVLQYIRNSSAKNSAVPVLVLTARDAIEDKVTGLDKGADDYLTKPFDVNELIARIRALLRRSHGRARTIIEYGELTMDPQDYEVTYQGKVVNLSPKEFAILFSLLEKPGKVVSKSKLEESIYSWDSEIESNALEVHIHHLRKKLSSQLIKTVRGVGYMLT